MLQLPPNSYVTYDVSLGVQQSGKLPFSDKISLVHNVKSQVWTQNKVVFQMFKERPIMSMLPPQLGVDIKTLW